ncbi:putative calcium-binding protein CML30 [Platanthera guangdongensis]|uniref:Calcium-binding protein CML30 n=1 Tax=Platanthera guangdongensis TaxID=2320717 RepID=A0ABR2LPT9_9ASPA
MEKTSAVGLFSSQLISFIILETVLCFFTRFIKFSRRYFSSVSRSSKPPNNNILREDPRATEMFIRREEVELVVEKMGLIMGGAGDDGDQQKLNEFMRAEEVAAMFEEKEPSLEEVKEAFDVFDENGDGFVDAGELQRLLWKLGFKEGVGLDACRKMIGAHTENGDGKMDFGDFVKFMESSFC